MKDPSAKSPDTQLMARETRKTRSKLTKIWTMVAIAGLGVATAFAIIDAINESALTSTPGLIWGLLTGIPLVFIVVIGVVLIFGGKHKG